MRTYLKSAGIGAAALILAACGGQEAEEGGNAAAEAAQPAESEANRTIAAGLDQNSRFIQAAKSAGLDTTLAGPGPYTVLVPSDEAFGKLPEGRFEELTKQENRAELTRLLTYHILPGTVLAEDIGRAIENSDGRAILATMGGGTLTARRDGDRIVLTDSGGREAIVAEADVQRSNGVVHRIDAVLVPGEEAPAAEGGQAPR